MLRNSRMDHLLIPPSWGLFQLLKQICISQVPLFLSPWALQALPVPRREDTFLSQLKHAPISDGNFLLLLAASWHFSHLGPSRTNVFCGKGALGCTHCLHVLGHSTMDLLYP